MHFTWTLEQIMQILKYRQENFFKKPNSIRDAQPDWQTWYSYNLYRLIASVVPVFELSQVFCVICRNSHHNKMTYSTACRVSQTPNISLDSHLLHPTWILRTVFCSETTQGSFIDDGPSPEGVRWSFYGAP